MKVKTLPHPQSTVFVTARLSYLRGIIISVLGRELEGPAQARILLCYIKEQCSCKDETSVILCKHKQTTTTTTIQNFRVYT